MKWNVISPLKSRIGRRRISACGAMLVLALPLPVLAGCSDEVQDEFRAAALSSVETGLKAIADGLITGLVTIATPDSENGGTTSTEGASAKGR